MTIFFSKSANGFFIEGINTFVPADRVEISQEVWQHLLSNQSPTSHIGADAEGNPILIDATQEGKVIYSSVGDTSRTANQAEE